MKSVVAGLLLLSAVGSVASASNDAPSNSQCPLENIGDEAQAMSPHDEPAPSDAFMKNLEKHMPDLSDEMTNAHLRCSACSAIAHELHDRLTVVNERALAKGYKSGAKDYEFVDTMDLMCREMHKTWGLKVRGDTVEPDYVHSSTAKYQIRSGWAMSFLQDRCAEITDVHEEKIFRLARRGRELPEWLEYTCVLLDRTCTATADSPANVAMRREAEEEEKKRKKAEALAKKKAEEAAAKKKNEEKDAAKKSKAANKDKKSTDEAEDEEQSVEKEVQESLASANIVAPEGSADL